MSSALDHAQAELERALASASLEDALLAICRAWARCPSPRLAELALAFARALPEEPVAGDTQRQREERWHALSDAADPRALPALLATPWTKRPADAMARLEKLARFPPDPRIVHALLELDTGQRFLSAAGNRFWVLAFELMLGWGAVEAAQRIPKAAPPPGDPVPLAGARYVNIFEPVLASWRGRLPVAPELSAPLAELAERLHERVRAGHAVTERLVEAVFAAPGDDGARLVLADALSEAGDPRGEFIALSYAHERGELALGKVERLSRLLQASGRRWLGDLDGQVAPTAVFRRGFPAEVRLATRAPDATRRGWRTVEVLDTAGLALALGPFLGASGTAGLREVLGLSVRTLISLTPIGEEGRRRLDLVELESVVGPEVPPPTYPLHTLRIRGDTEDAARWYLASPFAGRIERLQLDVAVPPPFAVTPGRLVVERPPSRLPRVGALLGELDARGRLQALELVAGAGTWPARWAGDWRLTFERDARGRLGTLAVRLETEDATGLDVLLGGLPETLLSALTVRTERRLSPAAREAVAESLARALARQRALERRDVELAHPVPRRPMPVVYEGA